MHFFSRFEAVNDLCDDQKGNMPAGMFADFAGLNHVIIVVKVLAHVAQFGAKQQDIP